MDGVMLLRHARAAGLQVSAEGERLIIHGPRRLEPVAVRVLAAKPQVMRAIAAEEREIAWRIKVMRPQVPPRGAIAFLIARPGVRFAMGTCGSCGGPLAGDARYRCAPCAAAATAVLESSAWTTPTS